MRCPHCSHETPDGSFCVTCGGALRADDALTFSPLSLPRPLSPGVGTPGGLASSTTPPFAIGLSSMVAGYMFASRYRIDRLLGAGGMGAVYQAWDQELGVSVALKVIRPEITGNPSVAQDFERRFKQELLMARQVTHRNVTRIHDLGESAGIKYITMQYVEGTDLATILEQGRPPFERVLSFAKQLSAGIAAAHDVGVIHRDLKPQNILIDAADNLYISDFGLAKSLETTLAGITRTGELVGTPRYIAPEQIRGNPVDHRTDLYAVGLILFEMATGGSAFGGNSAIEMMYQRVQESPKDPRALCPDLPEYFCRVITRCLEREPESRYSTAHDLLHDLEAGRATAGPAARRTMSIVLPLPATRGSRMALGAVVAAMILIAVPATVYYGTLPSADASAESGPTLPQKRIAVLPFRVVGDEATLRSIAAGIEETMSTKLFQVSAVNVASAADVERATTQEKAKAETEKRRESPEAVARELGVSLLVSGTVQGTADQMLVTVGLVDPVSGKVIWTKDFSGVPADLLAMEDRIYGGLLAALGLDLSSEEKLRAVSHPTENIDAYQLYLRGRNAMRSQQDIKNVQAAIGLFKEAVKKDPAFARAYAGIADSAVRMFRVTRDKKWADEALSAALQAQSLDANALEVRLALGSVYTATSRNAEAIAELNTAASLAPNSDDVFRRLGRAYLRASRGDEAIAAYERGVEINPYYWVSHNALGVALLQLGRVDAAVAALQKVVELAPSNVSGHNDLGAVLLQLGRFDEAAASFKKSLAAQPTAATYSNLGLAYSYTGKYADAIPMFEKAVEMEGNNDNWVGNLADGYRWGGQLEKAAATYDTAIALATKALQVDTRNAEARGRVGLYYAKQRNLSEARKFIAAARAIDRTNVNLMYIEAVIEVLGGRTSEALVPIEQAISAGYPFSAFDNDPDLRVLRSEPRFKQLAKPVAKPSNPTS